LRIDSLKAGVEKLITHRALDNGQGSPPAGETPARVDYFTTFL